MSSQTDSQPLSPAALHILLALAPADLHGYGIMQSIADQYRMGPGTLYDNLQRLMDRGWIADAGDRDEEDGRRKYYRLTSDGRNAIRAEIDRLEKLFRRAKRHLPVLDARRP